MLLVKKSNQLLIYIIFIFFLLILIIIFRSFVLTYILKPFALLLWLFLRIFILSIDQKAIWAVLIIAITIFFIFKLNVLFLNYTENNNYPVINDYLKKLDYWRYCFSIKPYNLDEIKKIKKELIQMLVSVYASHKRISVNYELYESFKDKEITLPEGIYNFLYNEVKKNKFYNNWEWIRRFSKFDKETYYHGLEECLNYLENILEINNEKSIEKK